ncbi:hypothetical protein GC170_13435 [bacterium]|nr:hypothetical protein [bacterium]
MGPYDKQTPRDAFSTLTDPFSPPWAEALRRCLNLSAQDPTSRYAALANVDSTGFPQVRHVVMRGCIGDLGDIPVPFSAWDFWMITDRRSAKFDDLTARPKAEIAWYFREPREQFRFSGEISLNTAENSALRKLAYARLSPAAKVQFFWPEPGYPRRPEEDVNFQISLEPAGAVEPPENFAMMILRVLRADRLMLDGTPQNRWIYEQEDIAGWQVREVNP